MDNYYIDLQLLYIYSFDKSSLFCSCYQQFLQNIKLKIIALV